jgi:Fic-DOC domain mobile mystery protein B
VTGTDSLSAEPDGATALSEEERSGLLPSWIATRAELNDAERANITAAELALRNRRHTLDQVLDDGFVRSLHRLMFGRVWSWAGRYRLSDKNIGVPWWEVSVRVRDLVGDAALWTSQSTVSPMSPEAAAVRLHHRIVVIHPFANGNGRHGRAFTDLYLLALGRQRFSWGAASPTDPTLTRRAYIAALRAADNGDHGPLETFARS